MASNTLVDLFRPPEGMVGHFGLISAFCATPDFLEDATSTFSRLARGRREAYGKPFLFLLLDAHRTADRVGLLKPNEVPGLLELPPRTSRHAELFHAKVGLFVFGRTRTGAPAHLRLVVTTGNWTQGSAKRQLELAWQVDVDVVEHTIQSSWNDRADIAEAGRFFELALQRYDVAPALRPTIEAILAIARNDAPEWQAKRFVHSLKPAKTDAADGTSIFQQLVKLAPHDKSNPRDVVLCGSGFFEKPNAKGSKPEVLAGIDDLPGLKPGTRIALVRPSDAGALARWKGDRDGWLLCAAEDTEAKTPRTLHAKFIYVGRRWGKAVRDGWLYLGSGNLTKRGLLLAPNTPARGNVEAGVVLMVDDKMDADTLLTRLFVDLDAGELARSDLTVGETDDDVLDAELVDVPPILLVEEVLTGTHRELRLTWNNEAGHDVVLRWPGQEVVVRRGTAVVPLSGTCPSIVTVIFDGKEMLVPVLDARGHLCRVPRPPPRFGDGLSDLLDFPVPLVDEDDQSDLDDDEVEVVPKATSSDVVEEALSYPLQEGMRLIENVAALQAQLPNEMLFDWFEHLETRLVDGFAPQQVAAWQALELPILSTLEDIAFRPPNMDAKQTKAYIQAMRRVAASWKGA